MPSAGAVTAAGRVLEVSGQGEELLFMLFPHLRGLRVGQVEDTGDTVVIRASCRAAQARCPLCGAVSSRVHGGYARVVADGAAGSRPVLIALAVRRFRCPEPSCPKATFAEQAGGVSERYRRRSVPLLGMLAGFGLELAGRAAARLAGTMGMPVHSSTGDQARLAAVRAGCPHLDALAGHIRDFAGMMTRRQGLLALEDWLTRAEAGDQPELHSFAAGIRRDQEAVTAGLALPYSSAAMEGNVNKIKMIKRQMYGRAGFALLLLD